MVSQQAHAICRRGAATLLTVLLGTALATQAGAAPIQLTGGSITSSFTVDFTRAGVVLEGPGFSLSTNDSRYNFFVFTSQDKPPFAIQPGPVLDYSAHVFLSFSDPDDPEFNFLTLTYGGQSYGTLGGDIFITTPLVRSDDPAPVPFTLSGSLTAWSGSSGDGSSFNLDFIGGGRIRSEECCEFLSLDYRVEPMGSEVPEPATWLSLGSGLLGFAARRRSKAS